MDDQIYRIFNWFIIAWILLIMASTFTIITVNGLEFEDPEMYDAVKEINDQYKMIAPFLVMSILIVLSISIYEWNKRRKKISREK